MHETSVIESNKNIPLHINRFTNRNLFPEIYNISDLPVDHSLPLPKIINFEDQIILKQNKLDIHISLPFVESQIDLFLFLNKNRFDMFYQISEGNYSFNSIYLSEGKNLFEIFYKYFNKRSTSVYLSVKLEL